MNDQNIPVIEIKGLHKAYGDLEVLKGVDITAKRGDVVALIGSSGSGKSTLLQVICGTLAPTGGSLQVNGRIAALLELGSGFNPDFTGRENVYLNASVLGLSQQVVILYGHIGGQ